MNHIDIIVLSLVVSVSGVFLALFLLQLAGIKHACPGKGFLAVLLLVLGGAVFWLSFVFFTTAGVGLGFLDHDSGVFFNGLMLGVIISSADSIAEYLFRRWFKKNFPEIVSHY